MIAAFKLLVLVRPGRKISGKLSVPGLSGAR